MLEPEFEKNSRASLDLIDVGLLTTLPLAMTTTGFLKAAYIIDKILNIAKANK